LASLAKGPSRRKQLAASMKAINDRCAAFTTQLWNELRQIKNVTLYGPTPDAPRTSTVAFTVAGVASGEAARRLAEHGLFLSHGNFYAATVVERLGLGADGLVRAGCACYTTAEEVDRLIAGVKQLAS
jgi:selenocysteine lyase/cysteine desulfurase